MRSYRTVGSVSCLLIACALAGCHQPDGATTDRLVIGEVMMHAELAENLRTIAMPGGRVSGTPNAEQAADFVADKLRAYGLHNVHFEPFDLDSWISHEAVVTLLGDPPRVLDSAVALGKTISTPPEGVTAQLIDLGEGKPEDFAAHSADIPGKFVLVQGMRTRRSRVKLAMKYRAAGLVVLAEPDRDPIIGNGHTEPHPEPLVVVRRDEELLRRLAAGDTINLNIRLKTDNWHCRPRNVVAEIPGHGPLAHEVVILGAHLDGWHLAEAALDNGTGSAAILETARALAAVDWQPRRTVRFVWFMAEELGLDGSKAYVHDHASELDNIVAVINADMPGSPRGLIAFGHPEVESFLKGILADLRGYDLDVSLREAKGEWSDHAPFMQQGLCTLAVWGEVGPGVVNYHTVGDKYEAVDRRATVEASAVFAVLVRRLADAPDRPAQRSAPLPPEPEE